MSTQLLHLLVSLVVLNHAHGYQFIVNLPDSARTEIENCIEMSRKSPAIPWQAEMACGHEYFVKLGPNDLTDEDWAVFKTVSEENFGHIPPPHGISIRREVRTLSEEEWKNVTDVFKELYETGILQSFGRLHGVIKLRAHKGAAFLPWHRVFLAHFEQEMKKINPSVSLPYWDYTIDYEIPQTYESVMWTPCYFGENTDSVLSGAFRWMYGAHGAVISRQIAENFFSTRLVNKADMADLKEFCEFKDVTTGLDKEKTDHNLEILHDGVHDYIGGDMDIVENSAYDPIFWFHHAFIDYIWENFREHQTENCGHVDIESDYRHAEDIGLEGIIEQGLQDPIYGYSHLKNIDGLWRNWTEVFFKYEPQPECGGTCKGDYLYCDDENRCLSRTKDACKVENQARKKREHEDILVPQVPCESGTKLKGLRGDGRTIDTPKDECEDILEKERQEGLEPDEKAPHLERLGFVGIGICVGVALTTGVFLIVKMCRNRNK